MLGKFWSFFSTFPFLVFCPANFRHLGPLHTICPIFSTSICQIFPGFTIFSPQIENSLKAISLDNHLTHLACCCFSKIIFWCVYTYHRYVCVTYVIYVHLYVYIYTYISSFHILFIIPDGQVNPSPATVSPVRSRSSHTSAF